MQVIHDRFTRRKKAVVVHHDPTAGYRLADWFALHGYQAILIHRLEEAQSELQDIRPDVIVVDVHPAPSAKPDTLPRLQALCPNVPIIAMTRGESQTQPGLRIVNDPGASWGDGVFLCRTAGSARHRSSPH